LDVGTVSVSLSWRAPCSFGETNLEWLLRLRLMRITEPLKFLRTLSLGAHCLGLVFYSENSESATKDRRSQVGTNWTKGAV